MADLSKKIFGLVGALLCTGMAYGAAGPATCAPPSATTTIIRAEGTAEQVAALTFTCTFTAGTAITNTAGVNVQIFMSPAVPVTSRVITASGLSEATLTVTGTAAAAGGVTPSVILGTVSGSTINFSGNSATAVGGFGTGDTMVFTVTNVRVNATSLSVGTGVPPSVSETPFVSGAAVIPAALASTTVGFAQNGLGASRTFKSGITNGTGAIGGGTGFPQSISVSGATAGVNNFVICNPYSPARDTAQTLGTANTSKSLAAVLEINENFAQAFQTATDPQAAPQTPYATSGVVIANTLPAATTNATNTVISTHLRVNFANVPSNVTLLVPVGAIPSQVGSAVITWVTSETGTTAQTSDSLTTELNGTGGAALPLRAVAVTGGAGTVVFNVTTSDLTNLDKFEIPVFAASTANSVPGSSTPFTASVSFGPIGSTSVPNFVVGSSTTTVPLSTFSLCTTSLLFPFVTNQLGFDTGLAIANTSSDPFGTLGATPQAGTCTLNFYGNGAPTPSNVTTANIPSGTVYAAPLSSVGAGFQGYVIAQCTFQFAHGFAFITNGVGVNGGLSQGYLAGVIPDVNQKSRGADPISSASSGSGETLGQ